MYRLDTSGCSILCSFFCPFIIISLKIILCVCALLVFYSFQHGRIGRFVKSIEKMVLFYLTMYFITNLRVSPCALFLSFFLWAKDNIFSVVIFLYSVFFLLFYFNVKTHTHGGQFDNKHRHPTTLWSINFSGKFIAFWCVFWALIKSNDI